jgi:hypothetical protein
VNNMEQLQTTALCVTVLSASTVLLAVAHRIPDGVLFAASLDEVQGRLPAALGVGVDVSEQVIMAAALASARTSFNAVVSTAGRDVTHLLEGLSERRGLGRFLETWGLVQCGVIAAMLSQLLFEQPWVQVPAKELVKLAGELVR